MHIASGRATGAASVERSDTFTGAVWSDPVMRTDDGTVINNIFFRPDARTFWHFHERGQVLHVTSGLGLVCSEGGRPHMLRAGDTVWVPAGERHWHGGTATTSLCHTAISFGTTTWLHEVSEADYAAEPVDPRIDGSGATA